MITIKFRGQDAKTGEWLYGYYVEQRFPEYDAEHDRITGYTHRPLLFNDEPGQRDCSVWHVVKYNTVGQFSTLKDKKGYAADGWKMLNKVKGGGLGSPRKGKSKREGV